MAIFNCEVWPYVLIARIRILFFSFSVILFDASLVVLPAFIRGVFAVVFAPFPEHTLITAISSALFIAIEKPAFSCEGISILPSHDEPSDFAVL